MTERYALLPGDRTADALEQDLLEQWRAERLFERGVEARKSGAPFIFYDGPPTANGRPGIHHVFARTVKDLFCRHRAMLGHHVPRKAGWDTHGLPVEIEVEKALGISGKQDIEALGVEEFNKRCRESVWTYRAEWERLCDRIAHWMDYDNPYVTYTNEYIESEWWALKVMYDKGLLYRGHKILPYCPRCGTALSSHEVAQGYEDVEDPSLFVALDLVDESSSDRRRLIVWTTTPWTLVSNVALAVHPDLQYVELRKRTGAPWTIILAEARAAGVLGADFADRWDVVATHTGADFVGRRYRRPLDWVPWPETGDHELIVGADFVSADDGSGIVHMAPAFGADDYATGKKHDLVMLQPVDAQGRFDAAIPVVGGMWVKDADAHIIAHLKEQDQVWKAATLMHSYPHCWRCRTPLLYYARRSWFVKTTSVRDEMLARNSRMSWYPADVGEGRFGKWLENNIDWAISRDRYWGTPLPVWVNDADPDEIEVIGSYAELAARVGDTLPTDFDPHKPFIDAYTWPAASGTGTMRRVSEVIDAWFDSGSMPFAQWHYPFENRDVVAKQFPADFIAEGLDQTRGWFYSLLAIATCLDDQLPNNGAAQLQGGEGPRADTAPYRNVVVNDLVLDASGVKMSKSRGNVVNPFDVVSRHGADAVRLFLIASSQLGMPKRFDEAGIRETATGFLVTLRNVYSGMFAQYANFGWAPSSQDPPVEGRGHLDRWILSRLSTLESQVNRFMMNYDATAAARAIMTFVVDDVSNWYVRQSRGQFYDVESAESRAAFATLHEVLVVTCRLLAPMAPFLSDWIHRQLTGDSVHMADYVRTNPPPVDGALEAGMTEVRELCRLGRAAREDAGINVRRPLSRALCVVPAEHAVVVQALISIVEKELNVKQVDLVNNADDLVTLVAKPNFRSLGKTFGKATPAAAKEVAALSADVLRAFERGVGSGGTGGAISISADGISHVLEPEDLTIVRHAVGDLAVKEEAGRFAAIDTLVTPALRREGYARELVSRTQRLRKEQELAVSDRIVLHVWGDEEIEASVTEYIEWMSSEVLASTVVVGAGERPQGQAASDVEIDGLRAHVSFHVEN